MSRHSQAKNAIDIISSCTHADLIQLLQGRITISTNHSMPRSVRFQAVGTSQSESLAVSSDMTETLKYAEMRLSIMDDRQLMDALSEHGWSSSYDNFHPVLKLRMLQSFPDKCANTLVYDIDNKVGLAALKRITSNLDGDRLIKASKDVQDCVLEMVTYGEVDTTLVKNASESLPFSNIPYIAINALMTIPFHSEITSEYLDKLSDVVKLAIVSEDELFKRFDVSMLSGLITNNTTDTMNPYQLAINNKCSERGITNDCDQHIQMGCN